MQTPKHPAIALIEKQFDILRVQAHQEVALAERRADAIAEESRRTAAQVLIDKSKACVYMAIASMGNIHRLRVQPEEQLLSGPNYKSVTVQLNHFATDLAVALWFALTEDERTRLQTIYVNEGRRAEFAGITESSWAGLIWRLGHKHISTLKHGRPDSHILAGCREGIFFEGGLTDEGYRHIDEQFNKWPAFNYRQLSKVSLPITLADRPDSHSARKAEEAADLASVVPTDASSATPRRRKRHPCIQSMAAEPPDSFLVGGQPCGPLLGTMAEVG